jgi:hypothetical protein
MHVLNLSYCGCSFKPVGAGAVISLDVGELLVGGPMEYVITAAFLLAVVTGSFAAVIFGGYGLAQLIASAL